MIAPRHLLLPSNRHESNPLLIPVILFEQYLHLKEWLFKYLISFFFNFM